MMQEIQNNLSCVNEHCQLACFMFKIFECHLSEENFVHNSYTLVVVVCLDYKDVS